MAYTTRHRVSDTRKPTYRTVREVDTYWHTDTSRNELVSYEGELKTMDDNNNHSIAWAARNDVVIMSDCHLVKVARTWTSGSTTAHQNTWTGYVTGDVTGSISGCPAFPDNLVIDGGRALLDAYAKMNGSAINSGELLNDLEATVLMLRRPFQGAQKLLSRMIKSRRKRLGKTAMSAIKASSDTWLEYRYGWKPLIMDANSIIQEVHRKRALVRCVRLVARAGASDQFTTGGSWQATAGNKCSGSWTSQRTVKCNAGVMYDLTNRTPSEELGRILGTRPRDLPQTLWEVLPYSFVVDWFVPIGPWLQAVTPDPSITVRGHWITNVYKRIETKSGSQVKFNDYDWYGPCGSQTVTTEEYVRVCNTPLPSPFASPAVTLSKLHSVDAVSLLVQPILNGLKIFKH